MRRLIPALAVSATLATTAVAEPIFTAGAGVMTCAKFNEVSKLLNLKSISLLGRRAI